MWIEEKLGYHAGKRIIRDIFPPPPGRETLYASCERRFPVNSSLMEKKKRCAKGTDDVCRAQDLSDG